MATSNPILDTNIPIVNPDGTPTPEFEDIFSRISSSGTTTGLTTEDLDRQVNYPRPPGNAGRFGEIENDVTDLENDVNDLDRQVNYPRPP